MKKVLLGTSALIAAGLLAAPASAAEKIALGLGGKMEQYFGVVSQDDSTAYDPGVTGINTDTEVYFTGATTLDNGLTVGAVIQLEAQTSNEVNGDEQYAYIEGAFGRIRAGQKEGALSALAHEAPQYGLADDDVANFFDPSNHSAAYFAGNGQRADTTLGGQDFASVMYVSPTLAGFSLAASYMPNFTGQALQADTTDQVSDQYEVALAYNNDFGGFELGVDAAYLHATGADNALTDSEGYRAGLIMGFAGFQIGGSILQVDDFQGVAENDISVWNAGLGYKTGPYGVSLVYLQSEDDSAGDIESEYQQVSLHGSYAMGPGVTLAAAAFWAEGELDVPGVINDDVDGTGGIVGLQLAF